LRVWALLLAIFSMSLSACNPADSRVIVEWTTASEVNTSGFNLYRSEQADGPYVKINTHLIPAATDPLVGGKYSYQDAAVTSGRTYSYQLEDVELDGTSTRHGPMVVTALSAWRVDGRTATLLALGLGAAAVVTGVLLARGRRKSVNSWAHGPDRADL
jgi:hypothetical protein